MSSSYFYIKLFHEILHDPKMGRLTDNLWRRVIEVFLLAGENGHNGNLPSIENMAWELRLSIEELESNLQTLAKYDIVSLTPDGWHVTHFEKRQAAIGGKERVSAHRNRAKKQAYYADETGEEQLSNEGVTSRYTELDIEKSKSKKKSKSAEKAPRQRDPLFDAIAEVCNVDPATAGSSIAKVESALKKSTPPYTPEEVKSFGVKWWEWKERTAPPTLWKLKEQIGTVRQNGNGVRKVEQPELVKKVYR